MALLDMIPTEEKAKGIVLCGDLIDRGPKSMEVVQWCIDNKIQTVKGNHEEMMVDWDDNGHGRNYNNMLWLGNGGLETLESYKEKVDHPYLKGDIQWDIFKKHCDYMDLLPYYLEFPDVKNSDGRYLVISHSNIGNVWNVRNTEAAQHNITWGRPSKIKDVPEIYNVIGHTPQQHGARVRSIYSCIDTGCFYTGEGGYGRLTALQFPEMIIYEHENIDSKVGHVPFKNIINLSELKERKKKFRIE